MVIRQGDVFWLDLDRPLGSEPAYRRPVVVVQNDVFNNSAIHTVVVCTLTASLRRAQAPGNVLLAAGEANLPRESVVNVSQVYTVDRGVLGERLGALSPRRVDEIVEGLWLVIKPGEVGAPWLDETD